MRTAVPLVASLSSLLLMACPPPPVPDAGSPGNGNPPADAGSAQDGGASDAGAPDGGAPGGDAGAPGDGGPSDGGSSDAGAPDGGVTGPCSAPTAESLEAAHTALEGGANEVDLTADGCMRYVRVVEGGRVTSEEITSNGLLAVRWAHDELTSTGERDHDLDGAFDWRSEITRGPLLTDERVVITHDPGATGEPTKRETYTRLDETTIHVLVEVSDGAGGLVTDTEYDTTPEQAVIIETPAPGSGTGECSQEQINQLRDQMFAALNQGLTCSKQLGLDGLVDHITQTAATKGVKIECAQLTDDQSRCAEVSMWDTMTSGGLFDDPITVTIDPGAYFGNSACANNQLNLMWHELIHTYFGTHSPYDFTENDSQNIGTVDPTYACSALCFNDNATKCQCASCLGTDICDPRCAQFDDCDPDLGAKCECLARPRYYPSMTECTVECPSGLACAFASCREVSYACQ